MSRILERIASLERIERISFFETLFSDVDQGRSKFIRILWAADESSRNEVYNGMHANAVHRWEEHLRSMASPSQRMIIEAEHLIGEIIEDIARIFVEIDEEGFDLARFTEGELQLITALKRTINSGIKPNRENLKQFGRDHFHRFYVNFDPAYPILLQKDLIRETDGVFNLTRKGRIYANLINRDMPVWKYEYDELYIRAEMSQTHSTLCRRVYGIDLCQMGQVDLDQLHTLIDELNITSKDRVLDLGCGNGMITEYISDLTHAVMTGVDVADEAVKRARERISDKRRRLEFLDGNINTIGTVPGEYDVIISLDSLQIAVDLKQSIRDALLRLRPGGRMGIFWESWIRTGVPDIHLKPDNTRLAHVLDILGLSYRTINFTESNQNMWSRLKEILEELKPSFMAEGNNLLYETALNETRRLDRGHGCRYLYLVSSECKDNGRNQSS